MFDDRQRHFAECIARIISSNPFLPERIANEKEALGDAFVAKNANWNLDPSEYRTNTNLTLLHERAVDVLEAIDVRDLSKATKQDASFVVDLVSFVLFNDFREAFEQLDREHGKHADRTYKRFQQGWQRYLPVEVVPQEITDRAPHLFAILFQLRRAFDNIFGHLIGSSPAIIRLRANVWRSIFTHDLRRYVDSLYRTMADFPTLITGPTGSGKELVARAIGLSSFTPFDANTGKFSHPLDQQFVSLNLSAINPQLIESSLFGHAKGAYTGASEARVGWLESCPPGGAVFLDEIGELDQEIQVKLLRVLQDRVFHRLGDQKLRRFAGRIIAATNRDLATQMRKGAFRTDFYYRLCADRIQTPGLSERVQSDSTELRHLVAHLLQRITGDQNIGSLTRDCLAWIRRELGDTYSWPGNVRELEQCLRSWLIRREYEPCELRATHSDLEHALEESKLTADELLSLYCRVKYRQSGSYVKTAQLLGLDRRTVKARVNDTERNTP